jgi:hypothetical protein
MRLPIAALAALVLTLAVAGPASAKQPLPNPADFSYIATIDCGYGPLQVGSTDDIYAPLVDLANGRTYEPVAWDVSFGDFHFVDSKDGVTKHNSVECSYVDEWVAGTVTVKRSWRGHHDRDDGHGDHHGGDHHDRWDRGRHGRHNRHG